MISNNELSIMNSLKMKLSVILVVQMGVFLKGVNNINFKQPYDFLFELIILIFNRFQFLPIQLYNLTQSCFFLKFVNFQN